MAHKAPGKAFREGISLIDLFKMFPDEETATTWFEGLKWGKDLEYLCCPRCGCMDKVRPVPSKKPMPYWCGDCRRNFSVRIGTVMEKSKIPLQKWAIAMYLNVTSLKGVSSMKLHRDLDISQRSAWFMGHRIREAMKDEKGLFEGPVEIDETYVGGLERNKHKDKKQNMGRGAVGKEIVVGIKDRKTNKIHAEVVEDTKQETLHEVVNRNVDDGADKFTDENRSYRGLKNHKKVNHSMGKWVDEMAHTNGIESFWSMFKRGFHGTYHKMSHKHLHRYINEFSDKHNIRPMDTISQMETLAGNMDGKRLTYEDLVA